MKKIITNIINFFKKHPIILAVIAVNLIGVLTFVIATNLIHDKAEVEINTQTELPNLIDINADVNPMLYDFVNSSLGYKLCKDGYDFNKFGAYYAVLQNKEEPENIYVEWYNYADSVKFPILGTEPLKFNLNTSEKESIVSYSSSLSENRIIREGNWSLYIVSQYNTYSTDNDFNFCDKIGRWAGVDFVQFNISNPGQMEVAINGGLGWPTDWLRNDIYVEICKDNGFDIFDKFWDKYNINSFKTYKNDAGEELKITVAQIDSFEFKNGGQTITLNEDEVNDMISTQGWK